MSRWKPFAAGLAFGLAAAIAAPGAARSQEPGVLAPSPLADVEYSQARRAWADAPADARFVVDRLAAAYFEDALGWEERAAFESEAAEVYRTLTPEQRNEMRGARKARRAAMTQQERLALFNQKEPSYDALSEARKMELRATGFALLAAMPGDIRAARLAEARSTRGFVAYAAMQSAPQPTAGVISVGY